MAEFPGNLDDRWQRSVRRMLLRWYRQHGRLLPWRGSEDPYRVWISEIMLQQTTIAAVTPYFNRFLKLFPTVRILAAADESQVLRAWEGLGYYSRARNLHRTARVIADAWRGQFPVSVDELEKLPGIGPYTARAIASFAFGKSVGIVEANTLRFYSRLIELETDPRSTAGSRLLWQFADWIVAPRRAADFNQAAMDVGATICTASNPECGRCPVRSRCCVFRAGRQNELPAVPKKQPMTSVTEVAVVICRRRRVLMRQYNSGERWAGLWDFVRFPISVEDGNTLAQLAGRSSDRQVVLYESPLPAAVFDEISGRTGLRVHALELLKQIRHTVTRYRIRLLCVQALTVTGTVGRGCGYRWISLADISRLPLSTTAREIAGVLTKPS